jgi:branched-subunit amino acid transport protein AzlD
MPKDCIDFLVFNVSRPAEIIGTFLNKKARIFLSFVPDSHLIPASCLYANHCGSFLACCRHDSNQTGANSLVQTSFSSLFRLTGFDADHGPVCYPIWKSGAENRFPLVPGSPLCHCLFSCRQTVHYLLRTWVELRQHRMMQLYLIVILFQISLVCVPVGRCHLCPSRISVPSAVCLHEFWAQRAMTFLSFFSGTGLFLFICF